MTTFLLALSVTFNIWACIRVGKIVRRSKINELEWVLKQSEWADYEGDVLVATQKRLDELRQA